MSHKIIIFGSSGHARSIAVVLEQLNYEIVGFVDSFLPKETKVLNYKTIGDESSLRNSLKAYGTNKIVIGIGDIYNRQKVVEKIKSINSEVIFPCIISPASTVTNYTSIGQGSVVFCNSFVNVECVIGDFCVINSSSIIEHNTTIGNYCNISPGVNIGGNVNIEHNTFVGSSATIIQKRRIGSNSVIGAGAIVTKDIPSNVLAVGMPAIIKKQNYFNKNIFS